MLKEIIRALSKMKVPYSEMPMFFDRSKTAIYGWGQGKEPKNVTIAQLCTGVDQCRSHYLKLDHDTFIKQLIYYLDIPRNDQDDLWEEYVCRREMAQQNGDAYYQQFITDLILHESIKPRPSQQKSRANKESIVVPRIAVGGHHILAVKENGHVLVAGENDSQQCATHYWRDIVSVGAGWNYSAGLKKDGTCIVAGQNMIGNGDVFQWRDLTAIACGPFHMLGLCKDGNVKAYGRAGNGQCLVNHWNQLQAVAAGNNHSVGLKNDGTVICAGKNDCGQCETDSWENIVSIVAAGDHTIGLSSDGTILAAGDVAGFSFSGWTDITAIATGLYHVVGLRNDGTVIATGHESAGQCDVWKWHNIVEIAAGAFTTVAINAEGNVLCTHDPHQNSMLYLDTSTWKLFEPVDPSAANTRTNRYELLRKNFLSLLLQAKESAMHFTVNAYPLSALDGQDPDLEAYRAEEANRHMAELFAVSKQIWELHEQYKPLKPLTDLMLQYSAMFCDLHSSLTIEISAKKKMYQTGEHTKHLLDQLNIGIRELERCLREAQG